jgi:hypothetical protein
LRIEDPNRPAEPPAVAGGAFAVAVAVVGWAACGALAVAVGYRGSTCGSRAIILSPAYLVSSVFGACPERSRMGGERCWCCSPETRNLKPETLVLSEVEGYSCVWCRLFPSSCLHFTRSPDGRITRFFSVPCSLHLSSGARRVHRTFGVALCFG